MIKTLLAMIKPKVKRQMKNILNKHSSFITCKDDLIKVKNFINDVMDEVINEYISK